jgi:V8-like Glu-specific endopeptidase
MKKCVCKIHSGKAKGTGFFTKIPFKKSFLPALITNNHILGINEIMNGRNITISLNNESKFKNILIDEKRKRYTNEILDVTIIELNEEKDDIKYFLTLDDQILSGFNSKNTGENNYFNNIYQNESLYLLNYLRGEQIFVSYGLLENIQIDEINHKCSTDKGSSGSPILLLKSNKVIGVHNGSIRSDSKFNIGKLLIKPLIEFQTIQNISNNFLAITKENSLKSNYLDDNISKKVNIYINSNIYFNNEIKF